MYNVKYIKTGTVHMSSSSPDFTNSWSVFFNSTTNVSAKLLHVSKNLNFIVHFQYVSCFFNFNALQISALSIRHTFVH